LAVSALPVPLPGISGGWPALPVDDTPDGWTGKFVQGLLDIDYARMSRSALGAWLNAQEAPELIPGVPGSVADKVLYVSLLEPDLVQKQATPIPSAVQWQADSAAGVTQSVSDLLVQADPSWRQIVASGWQPADVRMTEEDVSGLLTVRSNGTVTAQHFSLQVYVGSARWHDGYGTIVVTGWQES
jgi:hypothetical protein